jgi:hypothetical protein
LKQSWDSFPCRAADVSEGHCRGEAHLLVSVVEGSGKSGDGLLAFGFSKGGGGH